MKQTEHCSLNQWELSDRIRMEDFNADNLTLDSLLSNLTFLISRLALETVDRTKRALFPAIAINEQFNYPEVITSTEGVTIQDGIVTLAGAQTAVLTCGAYSLDSRDFSHAIVWAEHSGGELSISLNGVPAKLARSFHTILDRKYRKHEEFSCLALPAQTTLSVTLNLDRGANPKMELHNFSVILF